MNTIKLTMTKARTLIQRELGIHRLTRQAREACRRHFEVRHED